jgi:hypothetical protein
MDSNVPIILRSDLKSKNKKKIKSKFSKLFTSLKGIKWVCCFQKKNHKYFSKNSQKFGLIFLINYLILLSKIKLFKEK